MLTRHLSPGTGLADASDERTARAARQKKRDERRGACWEGYRGLKRDSGQHSGVEGVICRQRATQSPQPDKGLRPEETH